jgi:DNA-binding XRE family transcriptional regulator
VSAADLAFEVGVDLDTYIAWEDDKEKPRAYRTQRLATVFGVSVNVLSPPTLTNDGSLTRAGLLSLLETLKDRDECLTLLALAQKAPRYSVQSAIELLS